MRYTIERKLIDEAVSQKKKSFIGFRIQDEIQNLKGKIFLFKIFYLICMT